MKISFKAIVTQEGGLTALSKRMGVSKYTLHLWCQRNGIPVEKVLYYRPVFEYDWSLKELVQDVDHKKLKNIKE